MLVAAKTKIPPPISRFVPKAQKREKLSLIATAVRCTAGGMKKSNDQKVPRASLNENKTSGVIYGGAQSPRGNIPRRTFRTATSLIKEPDLPVFSHLSAHISPDV
jgi:hypothetical protein